MSIFSYRLRLVRRQHSLTQEQVAETLGLSREAVSNYERGLREPDLTTFVKLTKLLCISADFLLGLTYDTVSETTLRVADEISPQSPLE